MLHILRTEPDPATLELINAMNRNGADQVIRLFEQADKDWEAILTQIFSHEKVVCWW